MEQMDKGLYFKRGSACTEPVIHGVSRTRIFKACYLLAMFEKVFENLAVFPVT